MRPDRLALLVLLAAVPLAAQVQSPALLTLPRGAEYALPPAGAPDTLRIPVRLARPSLWPTLKVVVTDVHRDSRAEEWMRVPLDRMSRTPAGRPGGTALLVPLAAGDFREAGTYTVEMEVSAGARTEIVQLRLTRRPAQVAVAPLQLRRVLPLRGGPRGRRDSLLVAETSGAGTATLTPRPPLFGVPGGATLRFSGEPVVVRAGHTARIPFRLDGHLPLGTTSGTLRLASDQLAAPVDVPVSIVVHRAAWTLILAIILGLLAGWLVRTYLTKRIELGRLRLQADDVLGRMEETAAQHGDATLHAELRALAVPLCQARDGGTPATLVDAITKADEGLRTALEALRARLATASERVTVLGRFARTEWALPEGEAEAFASARQAVQAAEAALSRRDAAGATVIADAAEGRLRAAADGAVDVWPIERKGVLDRLVALLPAPVPEAEQWITAIRAEVDQVQRPQGTDLESLRAPLKAMHRARLLQAGLATNLPDWMDSLANEVRGGLGVAVKQEAWAALQATLQAFRAAATSRQDPDKVLRQLAYRDIPGVEQALDAFVRAHTPAAAQTDVDALLDARRYAEAARRAVKPPAAEGPVLGDGAGSQVSAMDGRAWSAVPGVTGPTVPRGGAVPVPDIGLPERARVHRARVWWQLMLDQLLLTLMVGTAITIVGYYLYAADFVGHGRELLAIFLWAFGLDVGLETLIAQSTRLAAPGAGALVPAMAGGGGGRAGAGAGGAGAGTGAVGAGAFGTGAGRADAGGGAGAGVGGGGRGLAASAGGAGEGVGGGAGAGSGGAARGATHGEVAELGDAGAAGGDAGAQEAPAPGAREQRREM